MRIMLSDREQKTLQDAAYLSDNTPMAAWVRETALAKAGLVVSVNGNRQPMGETK